MQVGCVTCIFCLFTIDPLLNDLREWKYEMRRMTYQIMVCSAFSNILLFLIISWRIYFTLIPWYIQDILDSYISDMQDHMNRVA